MIKKWTISSEDMVEYAPDFDSAYKTAMRMMKRGDVVDVIGDARTIIVGPCQHREKLTPITELVRSLVDGSYEPDIVGYACPICGEQFWI